jgi:hypothetical protein
MKKRFWLVVLIVAWAATGEGVEGSNLNRTATEGWATARIRDLRLGLEAQIGARPTYEDAESIAAAAAAGINPGRAARLIYVDGAATNTAQTGSACLRWWPRTRCVAVACAATGLVRRGAGAAAAARVFPRSALSKPRFGAHSLSVS